MKDGEEVLFNSYSCALAIVDEKYRNLCNSIKSGTFHASEDLKSCMDDAIEARFIVDDNCDEMLEYENERNIQKYSTSNLDLTIAPTLSCNFACTYCYENNKQGVMNYEIQDSIIAFVEKRIQELSHLNVNWYGGEPLLAPNIITNLSSKLLKLCKDNNVLYTSSIVTNGSLIDEHIISILKNSAISSVQITIDGPQQIHDTRRKTKNGESSYHLLLSNINKLLSENFFNIAIRVNIDKTNQNEIEELFRDLSNKLCSKNIKIYFGHVSAYTDACKSIESICLSDKEYALQKLRNFNLLCKYGFASPTDLVLYPTPKNLYCSAEMLNAFVIDPQGYMYKCWNEVGDLTQAIDNVKNTFFSLSTTKNSKWAKRNITKNPLCSQCKILPICSGGCPQKANETKEKVLCDSSKYILEDSILNLYEQSK